MAQLLSTFQPGEICPSEAIKKADGPMSILSLQLLKQYLEQSDTDIKLVSGHFPFCTAEMLGSKTRTFTILREPVERTLSFLRHSRKMTPALKNASLESIYDDEIRFHGLIHNHMVKMFSLPFSPELDTVMQHVVFTEDHLKAARKNLRQVDVVGLQENYAEFCNRLRGAFGWNIDADVRQNTTKSAEPVRPEFIRQIKRDNLLDIRFYKYAEKLIAQRKVRRQKT